MIAARQGHTATLLQGGQVLVAGGTDGHGAVLSSAEIYDPATGRFRATGNMLQARSFHSATLLPDGEVLVAGGQGAGAAAELYNPGAGQWFAAGSMAQGRSHHAAALLPDGRVLVAGGVKPNASGSAAQAAVLASAELYTP